MYGTGIRGLPMWKQASTASGEYDVQIGLFFSGTGDGCSFGIEGRISDGYYEGRMILELGT